MVERSTVCALKSSMLLVLSGLLLLAQPVTVQARGPSRPAIAGCAWEKFSNSGMRLEAWVQRCDFGFRKIDFVANNGALDIRYSDGGVPFPVIDVFDLRAGETSETGIRRLFTERTDKALVSRCVLVPYRVNGEKTPPGVRRYTFVPDAAYHKELAARADPNEVPEPPCGDYGDAPDGIQYFEAQPASASQKVLFVRVGQDEPLFDEQTLRLLPAR
jgi:hypothetical protein